MAADRTPDYLADALEAEALIDIPYRHRCWVPGCPVCDPTSDRSEPFDSGDLVWVDGYYQEQPAEVVRCEFGAVLVRGFGWFNPSDLSREPWEGQ